ncbi:MAG TPA: 6,7-dimethyl-8-ribityllumazine synthase [Candidatus Pelagibacter bacterium]|jgi:6,7-dimethyl-8-ribityllumazine synthase|nr:6,7-dimethyl-8-ribityllumazine synthase [Candidatus Pelagibacter bacterium]|tara:strand:+ start:2010 stop:2417 length:408 start_codon:yes stop_codon:yes gene_type:complete
MKYEILIVTANYYAEISSNLLKKAKSILKNKANIKIIDVPGVFEIPVVISKNIKKFDGFIALGCVIKGETPHFDFITQATTNAIMNLSIKNKKPVSNGIITCLNMKQATARSNYSSKRNKGLEASKAVLSVLNSF